MDYNEFEKTVDELKDSLGDDGAKNAETFIALKSAFKGKTDEIAEQGETITKLESDNKDLLETNGKLFQQIGKEIKGNDVSPASEPDIDVEEKLSISDIFDSKGHYI
ncbi:MAG: hypothetical protein IKA99_02580 [Clostridia bacterium]|nr:hypothetical protein [Clostridia bacterium]